MGATIQVWDLDLIDGLKPAFELDCSLVPRVRKTLKKLEKYRESGEEEYGVMSLAWNKHYE